MPANRLAVVEVFADRPLKLGTGQLRLTGTWRVSSDADGWRYQLHGAEVKRGVTRRALMAASPLFCLPVVPAMAQVDGTAVDIHSHAGNLIRMSYGRGQFAAVAEPMRQGGVSAICLAVVSDSPIIKTMDGRLRPGRDPRPGELYDFSQRSFQQIHALAGTQRMPIVRTAAELDARGPLGRRSSSPRKAPTSSRAGSSASTRPTSAGRCAICSSRTIARTSWATSRPSPACMAA